MCDVEAMHNLYEQCKNVRFDEVDDLIVRASDADEREFFRTITDLIIQQRQRKAVAEKRF